MWLLTLVLIGVAAGTAGFTVARTKITARLRNWVAKHHTWSGQLLACPYCLSHWFAAIGVLIYQPRPSEGGAWLVTDLGMSWLVAVAVAASTFGLIGKAMKQL